MNVLSLFDGMSCGRIALERAGVSVTNYFASEIDKHAIKVAMHNYPDTQQLGDVTKWREWDLPKIDLLIGGSPCQGFSFAGKQLAFDDPRSKLFFEFVECLKHFKPKHFLLENVRMKKEPLQVITDILGVEPIRINSNLVSAQNRDRYYWTNIPNVTQPVDREIYLKDILQPDVEQKYFLTASQRSWLAKNLEYQLSKKYSAIDPDKAITLVARMYANWTGNFILTRHRGNNPGGFLFDLRKCTPIECERLQTVPQYSKLLEISLCLDQAKNFVNAVEKNHKLLKLVLSAENEELKEYAKLAELNTRAKKAQIKSIVQQNADIQTQSQIEKCMLINQTDQNSHAGNAASITTYKQAGIEVDFVAHCAFMNITEGKTIHFGKEVLHQKDQNYTQLSNGKIALSLCGSEMLHNAKDALSALEIMQTNHHFTSITSSHLNTKNLEQILIISYWFAKSAIDGFTQDTINKRILYLNLIDGYTNHVSDSQRYKMLGNGWTVDVVAHIFSGLPVADQGVLFGKVA